MSEHETYKSKRVVVTGAASGIGRQTTEFLLAAGAQVIALDRNPSDLKVQQFISVDLTEPQTIDAAAKKIDGEIDVLLNIAGVPGTVDPEVVMRVNVLGLRMLTNLLIDRIRSGGSVTHVASIAGAQWAAHLDEVQRLLATPDYAAGIDWLRDHPMDSKRAYDFSKSASLSWPSNKASGCASEVFVSTQSALARCKHRYSKIFATQSGRYSIWSRAKQVATPLPPTSLG